MSEITAAKGVSVGPDTDQPGVILLWLHGPDMKAFAGVAMDIDSAMKLAEQLTKVTQRQLVERLAGPSPSAVMN